MNSVNVYRLINLKKNKEINSPTYFFFGLLCSVQHEVWTKGMHLAQTFTKQKKKKNKYSIQYTDIAESRSNDNFSFIFNICLFLCVGLCGCLGHREKNVSRRDALAGAQLSRSLIISTLVASYTIVRPQQHVYDPVDSRRILHEDNRIRRRRRIKGFILQVQGFIYVQ